MDVWVIEHGDYEQRGVWGVASSAEAATKLVRDTFKSYPVKWDDPICHNERNWTLTGHFKARSGYCAEHSSDYDFSCYAVDAKI